MLSAAKARGKWCGGQPSVGMEARCHMSESTLCVLRSFLLPAVVLPLINSILGTAVFLGKTVVSTCATCAGFFGVLLLPFLPARIARRAAVLNPGVNAVSNAVLSVAELAGFSRPGARFFAVFSVSNPLAFSLKSIPVSNVSPLPKQIRSLIAVCDSWYRFLPSSHVRIVRMLIIQVIFERPTLCWRAWAGCPSPVWIEPHQTVARPHVVSDSVSYPRVH
jgi:hypothetical protein